MGWACGMYGGEQRCLLGFGVEKLRVRYSLYDAGTDGKII